MLLHLLLGGASVLQPQGAPAPIAPPATARRIVSGSISNDDYPLDAARARAQGTATAHVEIDAGGRVTSCAITQSAGHALLDKVTCDIISTRFRFEPIVPGGPVLAASRDLRIAWRLPEDAPPPVPFARSRVTVETLTPVRGSPYCHRLFEGQPPEAMQSRTCHPLDLATASPHRVRTRMVHVVTLIADGDRLDTREPPRGIQTEYEHIRFDVDALGVVTNCTLAPGEGHDIEPGAAKNRCDELMAGGRPIFLPSPPSR
jgi:TonB family protein